MSALPTRADDALLGARAAADAPHWSTGTAVVAITPESERDGPPPGHPAGLTRWPDVSATVASMADERQRPYVKAEHATGSATGTSRPKPDTSLRVRDLSSIEAKAIRWLWRHRIPSKLAVLAGMPGCGKSQLTIAITAVLTTAGRWATGEPCELGRVIFVAAEDDPGDTIRPRLEAAGANLEYVQVVDGDRDDNGKPIPWTLDAVDKLAAHCLRYVKAGGVPVRLIVIDPISSYFGKHDSHNTAEVRGLLAPLLSLADEHGITVLAVTHLNKSEGSSAANRVTGSGALVAASRAAFVVGDHPEIDGAYCMATLKTNLSPDKTGVGYRVVPVTVGAIDTSRVEWIPGVVDVDADTLLAPKKDTTADLDADSAKGDAVRFLVDTLKAGPARAPAVYDAADAAGIARRTLERAKKGMHVRSVKIEGAAGWHWELPATREDRHASPPLADGDVGDLGEQHDEDRQDRQGCRPPSGPDGGDLPATDDAPDGDAADELVL